MAQPAVPADVQPIWCIVANVVDERPYGPGGLEQRSGLRLFRGRAKVFVPDGYAGMGYETVRVIGHIRHGSRLATVDVATAFLTNWRVKLVYSPAILARIAEVQGNQHRGFSRHGTDRAGDMYRQDLERAAAHFQQRTNDIHRQWEQRRTDIAAGVQASGARPAGRLARLVARLRALLTVR
ncbi:hypothetical protein ACFQS1_39915 [Paractinoplanes rhizophilus]|uniref:Uncharacterized protein n=1 Tax=Paractinoplanes rhizophilus TaxID=1416877 RepID=A0ABW2I5S8_9ACTN